MATDERAGYSIRDLQDVLGLTRAVILGYVKAGFVSPARGPRNAYRFGFADVVLLRTARNLHAMGIAPRRVRRSLLRLRAELPYAQPLTGLKISAVGDHIAVREGMRQRNAESGQWLLDFDVHAAGALLRFPAHEGARSRDAPSHSRASSSGRGDATTTTPDERDAHLDRGAALHEAARYAEALDVYHAGLRRFPEDAELHFNRAIALEDLGRLDDAVAAYQTCLAIDAGFADAHWNVARLYERLGIVQQALRHFSAFRRLER